MHSSIILAAAAMLLAPTVEAGLYPKSSPVMQVDGKNYAKLIEKSPYTSIVEFYAPWCGHCQNLKPAYEKAAKSLEGLANVAAVNCDDDDNKQFCGAMGVQGFPTLKIVRPPKKASGKPMIEDYRGERSAKGIVTAVTDAINNHVKRLQDKDRDEFMAADGPKALLFSNKGTISATIKTIAIDFLDIISVAQIRNTQKELVDEFGITDFPTLILVPADGGDPIVYDGEMKKESMVEFLSQAGSPRATGGAKKAKKEKKNEKPEVEEPEAESEPESEPEVKAEPETSAEPEKKVAPIPISTDPAEISRECLDSRSHICIMALVPNPPGDEGAEALNHLAEIYAKHKQAGRGLFKQFVVPQGNSAGDLVKQKLHLPGAVEFVAVNARRGWWKHYNAIDEGFTHEAIESWIDEIRMGEGERLRIPSGLVGTIVEEDLLADEGEAEAPEAGVSESAAEEDSEEVGGQEPAGGAEEKPREHEEL